MPDERKPDYGGATDAELAEIRSWYASGDWPVIEARLIREIVGLRRELAEMRHGMESANGVAAFRTAQLLEGQAKAAALLADRDRLDWLETNCMEIQHYVEGQGGPLFVVASIPANDDFRGPTLREAIDAARRSA